MNKKFRAFDKASKTMLESGFSILGEVTCFNLIEQRLIEIESDKPILERLNDVVIMQFTGIKDKNGIDIYEGDIIECKFNPQWMERVSWEGTPDAICEVRWDYCSFGLTAHGEKDKRYPPISELIDIIEWESEYLLHMNSDYSSVIGNIYDNPELLPPKD